MLMDVINENETVYIQEKEMDIKEAYRVMQKASGIKVGDKVKCIRHFKGGESGSNCEASDWNYPKKQRVDNGEVMIVDGFGNGHISADGYSFPFFALEVVEPAPAIEVTVKINGEEKDPSCLSEETWKNLQKG
jgi:hypothetical protein